MYLYINGIQTTLISFIWKLWIFTGFVGVLLSLKDWLFFSDASLLLYFSLGFVLLVVQLCLFQKEKKIATLKQSEFHYMVMGTSRAGKGKIEPVAVIKSSLEHSVQNLAMEQSNLLPMNRIHDELRKIDQHRKSKYPIISNSSNENFFQMWMQEMIIQILTELQKPQRNRVKKYVGTRLLFLGEAYQDQLWLEHELKSMSAEKKENLAKLLSITPDNQIVLQTVEQLNEHYGKEKVNKMKEQRFKNQRMVHELKLDPMYFRDLELGYKTFEIRKDDRPFKINDMLLLQSFDRKNQEYTGSMVFASIVGIFGREEHEKEFVKEGYVILSIDLVKSRYIQD